jgi:hypothetical protein
MAVLLCLAQTASAVATRSLEKTASGNFFGDTGFCAWENAPETLQPHWENDPTATPTASGRQDWLSADPIESVTGEMAEMLPEGSNLYSYIGNTPINGIDADGLNALGHFFRNLFRGGRVKGKGGAGAGAPCPRKFGTDMGSGGRQIAHWRGMNKALQGAKPPGVPGNWVRSADGSGGYKWTNPNSTRDYVRVVPAKPNSPHATDRVPTCRRQKDGSFFDKDGNKVPRKSDGSHIPLNDFWFQP